MVGVNKLVLDIMPFLKVPPNINPTTEVHRKWLEILKDAQRIVSDDVDLQDKAARGLRLKERSLPPEVVGRLYAQYCQLINNMYDAYLNSVHLQRANYIKEIITVLVKRMYELRNELVHLIVNDYIYVDAALVQLRRVPLDIQIVVPYHFPLEARSDTIENMLQKMWTEATKRKNAPPKPEAPPPPPPQIFDDEDDYPKPVTTVDVGSGIDDVEESVSEQSVHTVIPEEYIQANIIQKQERFRQFYMVDFRAKSRHRRMYNVTKVESAPIQIKILAAELIQKIYREFMKIKRLHHKQEQRDMLLGLTPNPEKRGLDYQEENNKLYDRRRNTRKKLEISFAKDFEREHTRLIVFKKEDQIDDITEDIREWFREWLYGYGFFPEYPYEEEGGTIMVIKGDFLTVEEKIIEDEKYAAATKGKTKEQLKQEKEQAKMDALLKAEAEKEQMKRDAEVLFKMKCNPFADPGYKFQASDVSRSIVEALQKYASAWSIYDNLPTDESPETVFGYLKPLISEDLMCQVHADCRKYVDELMRLELKLLIKVHQKMYKDVGWKYPKFPPRKKPKAPAFPKTFIIDSNLLKGLECVFDLGIISKPTSKIKEIYGDSNYAAYDLNIRDPDAKFPPPSYGDIKRRLILSCVFGAGVEPGAKRNKAVMLLGQERNGKSFLVDAVCGELNAIKIDISPEVFSAHVQKPGKVLSQVFLAAKTFQPAVIFMKNIERVYAKKVAPEQKYLKAKSVKSALEKLVRQISNEDKVIFIATCTCPTAAKAKPLVSLFSEILLVPRTDYSTLQRFFYEKLQSIKSMERDYCVQALAQMLQGYGFGVIIQLFNTVMNPERICRLNVTPLSPSELVYPLTENDIEPVTMEDYQVYVDFFIQNSPLKKEREEYEVINRYREVAYEKFAPKA